jgi:hypothetical protein
MKTPRQILIEQHLCADKELDRIQAEIILKIAKPRTAGDEKTINLPKLIWQTLWLEVLRPARNVWAGFAVAWCLLIVANLSQADHLPRQANKKPISANMIMAWKEQQDLLNELTSPLSMQTAKRPKPYIPQPRSERPQPYLIA